jgi:hypothetical protein
MKSVPLYKEVRPYALPHNLSFPLAGNLSLKQDIQKKIERFWTSQNNKMRVRYVAAYKGCAILA